MNGSKVTADQKFHFFIPLHFLFGIDFSYIIDHCYLILTCLPVGPAARASAGAALADSKRAPTGRRGLLVGKILTYGTACKSLQSSPARARSSGDIKNAQKPRTRGVYRILPYPSRAQRAVFRSVGKIYQQGGSRTSGESQ
jgi:hypothetical protein